MSGTTEKHANLRTEQSSRYELGHWSLAECVEPDSVPEYSSIHKMELRQIVHPTLQ